jgi:hypothetical protein
MKKLKYVKLFENFETKLKNATHLLPDWIKSDKQFSNSEVVIHVGPEWLESNKEELEKNIKEYHLLYSKSQQFLLKDKKGYNPEKDYIDENGTTFIDGNVAGHNSGDKLEYRTDFGNRRFNDIMNNNLYIDLLDPVDLNYIKGIISDEEVSNIKNALINKYGKSAVKYIYIEKEN